VATLIRYSDLAGSTKVGGADYTYDGVGRGCRNPSSTRTARTRFLPTPPTTYDPRQPRHRGNPKWRAATTYVYDNTDQLTNDGTRLQLRRQRQPHDDRLHQPGRTTS